MNNQELTETEQHHIFMDKNKDLFVGMRNRDLRIIDAETGRRSHPIFYTFDHNMYRNLPTTPLMIATDSFNVEKVKSLLDQGADPNLKNSNGDTALLLAIRWRHGEYVRTDIVQSLLDHGADINIQDKHGFTALIEASRGGGGTVIKLLLDYGADPHIVDAYGNNAIDYLQYNFDCMDTMYMMEKAMRAPKTVSRL
jgi:ankyrin repeat protein